MLSAPELIHHVKVKGTNFFKIVLTFAAY